MAELTMWVPLAAYPVLQKRSAAAFVSADSVFLTAFARLHAGVSTDGAAPIVAGLAARALSRPGGSATVKPEAPTSCRCSRATVVSASARICSSRGQRPEDSRCSILLITCTNVSALMVGLAVARRREIAVRLSLGAPRARLIRQLLTESVLLALVAAAVGLVVTTVGIRLIGATLVDIQLVVDWRVTIATCVVAIVVGILFGLSPALHATRISVNEVLKSASSSVAATRSRLQRTLVVAQITLTQPLLVGLGVMIMTLITDMGTRATSHASRKYCGDRARHVGRQSVRRRTHIANRARSSHVSPRCPASLPRCRCRWVR